MPKISPVTSCRAESITVDLTRELSSKFLNDDLPSHWKCVLEKYTPEERRQIVCLDTPGQCPPFILSCKRGLHKVVAYFIESCHVEIEKLYSISHEDFPMAVLVDTPGPLRGSLRSLFSTSKATALFIAVVNRRINVVSILLQHGANVNTPTFQTNFTPVNAACHLNFFEVVQLLVRYKADLNRATFCGITCLMSSVRHVDLFTYLLKCSADVNLKDRKSSSVLHYAISYKNADAVEALLDNANASFNPLTVDRLSYMTLFSNIDETFYFVLTRLYKTSEFPDLLDLLAVIHYLKILSEPEHCDSLSKELWAHAKAWRLKLLNPDIEISKLYEYKEVQGTFELSTLEEMLKMCGQTALNVGSGNVPLSISILESCVDTAIVYEQFDCVLNLSFIILRLSMEYHGICHFVTLAHAQNLLLLFGNYEDIASKQSSLTMFEEAWQTIVVLIKKLLQSDKSSFDAVEFQMFDSNICLLVSLIYVAICLSGNVDRNDLGNLIQSLLLSSSEKIASITDSNQNSILHKVVNLDSHVALIDDETKMLNVVKFLLSYDSNGHLVRMKNNDKAMPINIAKSPEIIQHLRAAVNPKSGEGHSARPKKPWLIQDSVFEFGGPTEVY